MENLENIIEQNQIYSTTRVGRYIIAPIYWSEDDKGNILYDVESTEDEVRSILQELEEENEQSEFSWDDEDEDLPF
jgi:hypothetical protein